MKIKILNATSEDREFRPGNFFHDLFNYFAFQLKDESIEWGDEGDILAVTNVDLESLNEIKWQDINLIAAETCQQIYDLSYKLDYSKAYVFVTESWVEQASLKEKFHGLPLIGHYAVFNEIFNYFSEMVSPRSNLTLLEPATEPPLYDFFCLIGRRTNLRQRFMYELAKQDLSKSLVKFNGKVIGNSGAPSEFDLLDYQSNFFSGTYTHGMSVPSKIIQHTLYNNFKLELQFETDSLGGQGWDLVEYHITEKTLKPLIMGKPCLMFGPWAYQKWLLQYDIVLSHNIFATDFDSIEDDQKRAIAVSDLIKKIDFDKVTPDVQQHQKNILGMYQLCNLSKANTLKLYRQLRLLTS